jgi:hypothetical protein
MEALSIEVSTEIERTQLSQCNFSKKKQFFIEKRLILRHVARKPAMVFLMRMKKANVAESQTLKFSM